MVTHPGSRTTRRRDPVREIYGPGTWHLDRAHADPRHPALLDWLTANGIDPQHLPVGQRITVDTGEHGSVIRYVVYVTNERGWKVAADDSATVEAHTTPLTVDPPDTLTAELATVDAQGG